MANEIYISAITGLTPSCQLYSGSSTVGSPFNATEIGTTGIYLASVPNGVAFGIYMVLATAGEERLGSGLLYWNGTQEITPIEYDELHRIQGLQAASPATTTQSTWTAGDIEIAITGDGTTSTTMTRQ